MQEGLVEVGHRTVLPGGLTEVGEHRVHAGIGQSLGQVAYEADKRFVIQVRPGDGIEETTQEGLVRRVSLAAS